MLDTTTVIRYLAIIYSNEKMKPFDIYLVKSGEMKSVFTSHCDPRAVVSVQPVNAIEYSIFYTIGWYRLILKTEFHYIPGIAES